MFADKYCANLQKIFGAEKRTCRNADRILTGYRKTGSGRSFTASASASVCAAVFYRKYLEN